MPSGTDAMARLMARSVRVWSSSTWTWDANYDYGLTHHDQSVFNNIHNYAMAMALDSVIDPATGQPVCRVTLDGFAGAVAANPSLVRTVSIVSLRGQSFSPAARELTKAVTKNQ